MHRSSVKSFSFLMEFMIVLFFFAISSIVCIQIYASSIMKNREANLKKDALEYAENYIEKGDYSTLDLYVNEDFEIDDSGIIHIYTTQDEIYSRIVIEKEKKELISLSFFQGDLNE